jgi:signal transduction histidine kinase
VTLAVVALLGWAAVLIAAAAALVTRHVLSEQRQAIARASHEVRGGLGAARLGMALMAAGDAAEARRLRAVTLELDRAVLALQELDGRSVGWAFEYVNLFELLTESVQAWQPAAAVHGAELRLRWRGERAVVIGDRVRLAQATGNLIANAIEHGGGVVEVLGAAAGDAVRVEVLDDGPGLPKPVAELRRDRRGQQGRGLGLGIAAEIVSGHGGRLSAAPTVGGARLVLELPATSGLQGQLQAS